jgi:hypothetical protein
MQSCYTENGVITTYLLSSEGTFFRTDGISLEQRRELKLSKKVFTVFWYPYLIEATK